MADSKQTARIFAERVAAEAVQAEQGHLPLSRDGSDGSAAWYRDGETMHVVVEIGEAERALQVTLGDDAKAELTQAVERAFVELGA